MTSRRASPAEGFFRPGEYEKLITKQRKGNITTLLEQLGERMEHANRNIDQVFSRILNLEKQMQRLDEKLTNLQNTQKPTLKDASTGREACLADSATQAEPELQINPTNNQVQELLIKQNIQTTNVTRLMSKKRPTRPVRHCFYGQ